MFDYINFFSKPPTDQVIERVPVADTDISEDFVEGSQGEVKELHMTSESNVDKMGSNILINKKVFYFKYENAEFPSFATSIEQKDIREEHPINE